MHDAYGAPLSYLLGGAPWVLGNLWDVTDKDIDRLSMDCMQTLLQQRENQVDRGNQVDTFSIGFTAREGNQVDPSAESSALTRCPVEINSQDYIHVGQSLPSARNTCKLKRLVGYAPIVYGLPTLFSFSDG